MDDTTSSTIPTLEDARQTALARRQATQADHDAQLLEQRSVLAGEAQLMIEELMKTPDVDDVPLLQTVVDVLHGKTPSVTASATEPLSDEEQELIEASRSGRLVKTDNGSYRDKEWGKRERGTEPTKKAVPEPTPAVVPEPEPTSGKKSGKKKTTAKVAAKPAKKVVAKKTQSVPKKKTAKKSASVPASTSTATPAPVPAVTPVPAPIRLRDRAKQAAKRLIEPNPS
jgi:outer membrane biosynthesis protein TonB